MTPMPEGNPLGFTPAVNARVEALIAHVQPSWESERRRGAVGHYMNSIIAHTFMGQVATCAFGSVPLKTCLPDGDIDLSIFTAEALRDSWAVALQSRLEAEGRRHDAPFAVSEVQVINAEVRLLKCLVDNIVVDVSFNQLGGLCTLAFLESVDRLVGRGHLFKRSIILVKAWCYYESRLLGAHHGLISTYALETLVLYIFNLHHRELDGPLNVLHRFVTEFCEFDWDRYCLSLQGPIPLATFPDYKVETSPQLLDDPLLTPAHVAHIRAHYAHAAGAAGAAPIGAEAKPFMTKCLNIQDALLPSNNLGRSVARCNLMRIRRAFAHGSSALAAIKAKPDTEALRALDAFFRNTWNANCPPPRGPPATATVSAVGGSNGARRKAQQHQQFQQQHQQSFHAALGGLPPVSVPKFAPMSAPPSVACTPHGAAPPLTYALPLASPREQQQQQQAAATNGAASAGAAAAERQQQQQQQAGAADAEPSGRAQHPRRGGGGAAAAADDAAAVSYGVPAASAVEQPSATAAATGGGEPPPPPSQSQQPAAAGQPAPPPPPPPPPSSSAPRGAPMSTAAPHAISPPPPPSSACASSPAASYGQSPTGSSPAGGSSPVGSLGVGSHSSHASQHMASPPGRTAGPAAPVPVPGPLLMLDGAPNLAHPGIQMFIQEVLAAQMAAQAHAHAHAHAHAAAALSAGGGQQHYGEGAGGGLGRGGGGGGAPHEQQQGWQAHAQGGAQQQAAQWERHALQIQEQLARLAYSGGGGGGFDVRGGAPFPPPLADASAAAAAMAMGAAAAPFPPPLGEPSLLLLGGSPHPAAAEGGGGGAGVAPASPDAEGGGSDAGQQQQQQPRQHDVLASDWALLSASLAVARACLAVAAQGHANGGGAHARGGGAHAHAHEHHHVVHHPRGLRPRPASASGVPPGGVGGMSAAPSPAPSEDRAAGALGAGAATVV
ncbi:hypothetical protein FOA52_014007 [Chlamydomonas sp. UWO 241]|nr:hypothetical protein FOA52_014007 [Chlamydomonas sp. UWO 241]